MTATAGLATAVLAASILAGSGSADPEVAVLPPSEAERMQQCSRAGPPPFDGTWTPTPEQISFLKGRLSGLVGMQSTACCLPGASIRTLSGMRIQVVGLVLSDTKARVLYLNGFAGLAETAGHDSWRTNAYIVCDGGSNHWGVLFDPETGTFSQLAFNGQA